MGRRLLLAALLAAGTACAQDCAGTWDGAIGGAPAMLQFNRDLLGSRSLGTALQGTVLRPHADDPQAWGEYDQAGHATGSLRLACSGDTLRGERVAATGERAPVQARRVEDTAYNSRRLSAVELVAQRALPANGRVVEVVAVRGFPQLTTLRIRQPRGNEAAVDERLRGVLLRQLDNHLQCQALRRARGEFDRPGGDSLTLQRLEWRGSILSAQFWRHGQCAGADPYSGLQQFTFDTAAGEELPLKAWLQPAYRDGIGAGTPLHDALVLPQILRGRPALEALPESRRHCAEFELAEPAVLLAVGMAAWCSASTTVMSGRPAPSRSCCRGPGCRTSFPTMAGVGARRCSRPCGARLAPCCKSRRSCTRATASPRPC